MLEPFSIGSFVEFPTRRGGVLHYIRAQVIDDPRNSDSRIAVQPIGTTDSGRKPAVRMRNRNKLVIVEGSKHAGS